MVDSGFIHHPLHGAPLALSEAMSFPRIHRPVLSALAISTLCAVGGCRRESPKVESATRQQGTHTDSAGGLVVAPRTPYVAGTKAAPASLVIKTDSVVVPPRADSGRCEVTAAKQTATPDVVFWVDGIR